MDTDMDIDMDMDMDVDTDLDMVIRCSKKLYWERMCASSGGLILA